MKRVKGIRKIVPAELAHAIALAQGTSEPNDKLEDMIDILVMGVEPATVGKHAAVVFRETNIIIDVLMAYRDESGVAVAVPRRFHQAAAEISKSIAKHASAADQG